MMITMPFLLPEGGAKEITDFTPIPERRIRWRRGQVDPRDDEQPFTIDITDDDITEETEYLEVHFRVDNNGYAFPSAIARVYILDNDGGELNSD